MPISNWGKIVKILTQKKETISVMESCTGGFILNELTNISGASNVLKEGAVTYSNEAKIKLGVSQKTIDQYSVYSAETAVSMAKATQKNASATIGVGITGLLGRLDSNNPDTLKSNHVWYAIQYKKQEPIIKELEVPNTKSRKTQKEFVARDIASNLLKII